MVPALLLHRSESMLIQRPPTQRHVRTSSFRRALFSTACGIVICCAASWFLFHRASRASAIETAQVWARLDGYPVDQDKLEVQTQGNMFTRGFTIRFTSTAEAINAWLERSPGTAGVQPKTTRTRRIYSIQPGGGAMFAEVTVDDQTGQVSVHTYWS
jgi:hypothetical protein